MTIRKKELFAIGPQRTFRGEERANIAFPIGGIGTGSISIGGWGQLRDAEIFNKPEKGYMLQGTFFSLYARQQGGPPVARVLQGPMAGSRDFPHGAPFMGGAGFPHFEENSFTGRFPVAQLDFADPQVPLEVSLEAFNPMIPLAADDSSIPAAIFLVHLRNPSSSRAVDATLFASCLNDVGHPSPGRNVTQAVSEPRLRGLRMTSRKYPPDSPEYGSMALVTPWARTTLQTRWPRRPVFDQHQAWWDQVEAGRLEPRLDEQESPDGRSDIAAMALKVKLRPGSSVTLPVILTWYFPNVRKYWNTNLGNVCGCGDERPVWRNHYATLFDDAWHVARHVVTNLKSLQSRTRRFVDVLYGSTLPSVVLDAAGSQMAVLKSTTCLRLPDGSFYGWEGCHPHSGCCEGSCSHVWNYAQTLHHLYPELQASMVENHFRYSLQDDGAMAFRMPLPLGQRAAADFHAAADGQMGIVLAVYRHWLVTGDREWLDKWWPLAKKALEYAWLYWDADRDGLMEGLQHNTYDIEFYGPNTMLTSLYLAALRAAEKMAMEMGQEQAAAEYARLAASGQALCDERLWETDYYVQRIDPAAIEKTPTKKHLFERPGDDATHLPDEPPYQYGFGCLSDQLIGQWYAHMLDLGYLLDRGHVRQAMDSVFRYNFKSDLQHHVNTHRVYAADDEAALVLCTWPHGRRERFPFIYAHETFPGIDYQVAAHLVYEGRIAQALTIVKGVRDRHDGRRRNPWNEVECGNHYARSLASWALIPALSGLSWNASAGSLAVAPRVDIDDFRCFFSTGSGWGEVRLNGERSEFELELIEGELSLRQLTLGRGGRGQGRRKSTKPRDSDVTAQLGGRKIGLTTEQNNRERLTVRFARSVNIRAGQTLRLKH